MLRTMLVKTFAFNVETEARRKKILPRLVRCAMRGRIAILSGTAKSKLFRVVDARGRKFETVCLLDPDRVVGVYELRGREDDLIEAIMEDLRDAAARMG